MNVSFRTPKVRWASVRLALVCLLIGGALGGLAVLTAPTQVTCTFPALNIT